jgi:hypothetical protein
VERKNTIQDMAAIAPSSFHLRRLKHRFHYQIKLSFRYFVGTLQQPVHRLVLLTGLSQKPVIIFFLWQQGLQREHFLALLRTYRYPLGNAVPLYLLQPVLVKVIQRKVAVLNVLRQYPVFPPSTPPALTTSGAYFVTLLRAGQAVVEPGGGTVIVWRLLGPVAIRARRQRPSLSKVRRELHDRVGMRTFWRAALGFHFF